MRPMLSSVLTRREGDEAGMAKRAELDTNQNAEAIGKHKQPNSRVHVLTGAAEVWARATSSVIQDTLREVAGLGMPSKLLTSRNASMARAWGSRRHNHRQRP
jgi:hypothetical protein